MATYRKEYDECLKILRYTECDSVTVTNMYTKMAPTYDEVVIFLYIIVNRAMCVYLYIYI